jgi:exonuclease SbcD
MLAKLEFILNLKRERDVDAIFCTGDLFHSPQPQYSIVNNVMNMVSLMGPFHVIPGQHDMLYHDAESVNDSAIGTLSYVPGVYVHKHEWADATISEREYESRFIITYPYSDDIIHRLRSPQNHFDDCGSGWLKYVLPADIAMVHGMVVPEKVSWTHITIDECDVPARVVLCGDYHAGFGVIKNGESYYSNPGALGRTSISDKGRIPQVTLFTIHPEKIEWELIDVHYREDVWNGEVEGPYDRSDDIHEFAEALNSYSALSLTTKERFMEKATLLAQATNRYSTILSEVLQELHRQLERAENKDGNS